jgi:DNA processing protein
LRKKHDLAHTANVLDSCGVGILSRVSPGYPGVFEQLNKPPELVYVRGNLQPVEPYAVSIVGTRRPTTYGKLVARDLAAQLVLNGGCVVSGLAYGVDAAAHQGAVDADGKTLAVLGTGVDRIYPRGHRKLAADLLCSGALLSEFPLGQPPTRWTFPQRNRLIAALGQALVVVQAGPKSGTRYTVEHALEIGREIFAVPGDVRVKVSRGPHQLLRDGAVLLEEASQLITHMGWQVVEEEHSAERNQVTDRRLQNILALLGTRPVSFDKLVQSSQLEPQELQSCLLQLELGGVITQLPGMRFVRLQGISKRGIRMK